VKNPPAPHPLTACCLNGTPAPPKDHVSFHPVNSQLWSDPFKCWQKKVLAIHTFSQNMTTEK